MHQRHVSFSPVSILQNHYSMALFQYNVYKGSISGNENESEAEASITNVARLTNLSGYDSHTIGLDQLPPFASPPFPSPPWTSSPLDRRSEGLLTENNLCLTEKKPIEPIGRPRMSFTTRHPGAMSTNWP